MHILLHSNVDLFGGQMENKIKLALALVGGVVLAVIASKVMTALGIPSEEYWLRKTILAIVFLATVFICSGKE